MQTRYAEFEYWYSGRALDATIENELTGEVIDKYPLHLNPLQNTCEKHAVILLGNNLESIRNGNIPVRFTAKKKNAESGKKEGEGGEKEKDPAAKVITDALIEAFKDNGAGAMFASNGILSQYHGGCVFGVSYIREELLGKVVKKAQIFTPLPTEFLGIADGSNPWLLKEAWFIREISEADARDYGITIKPLETNYWYVEHWTKTEYSITVNDQVITTKVGGETFRYEGKHDYGIVPFVYIPHIRVRNFYGESIINKTVQGLIKEMNLRWADTGDAVSADSHSKIAVRNVRDAITPTTLPDGTKAINLGGSASLVPGEKEPDLFAVRTQSASDPMLKLGDKLENLYRKEVRHPAVADGEDEGSQRSSLTLTTRMWPLVAHVDLERINWTTGLIKLAEIVLIVCAAKGIYGITEEHLNYDINLKWALTLPRDRDQLVNEVAVRKTNKLGSIGHLLGLFDDIDDVEEELEKIKAEIEEEAARDQQQREDAFNMEVKKNAANNPDDKTKKKAKTPNATSYAKQE
jgi:hypothetical protein